MRVLRQAQDDMQPAIGERHQSDASWVLPEAKSRDLLYITRPYHVEIYTFPQRRKVGVLSIDSELLYGECTNAAGDVFVTDAGYGAYEYRHGHTAVIASIYNPIYDSHACSIDPLTGDLAIASFSGKKVLSIITTTRSTAGASRRRTPTQR